jgi:hypothetical protein
VLEARCPAAFRVANLLVGAFRLQSLFRTAACFSGSHCGMVHLTLVALARCCTPGSYTVAETQIADDFATSAAQPGVECAARRPCASYTHIDLSFLPECSSACKAVWCCQGDLNDHQRGAIRSANQGELQQQCPWGGLVYSSCVLVTLLYRDSRGVCLGVHSVAAVGCSPCWLSATGHGNLKLGLLRYSNRGSRVDATAASTV